MSEEQITRLGDVAPSGRYRFDAIARALQDVSTDDAQAALLDGRAEPSVARSNAWVVRRLRMTVDRRLGYRDRFSTATWCSGIGPRWAERRTDITVDGVIAVRAGAIWVNVDVATGRPAPLPDYFALVYTEAAGGRNASQRLLLPPMPLRSVPEGGRVEDFAWPVRSTDFDVLGHVNNAAYLHVLESHEIAEVAACIDVEWRGGIDAGDDVVVRVTDAIDGHDRVVTMWLVVDGDLRATIRAIAPMGEPDARR